MILAQRFAKIQYLCGALRFLYYGKLRKIDLAVLHCLDMEKASIGKLLRAGVVRFLWKIECADCENALAITGEI